MSSYKLHRIFIDIHRMALLKIYHLLTRHEDLSSRVICYDHTYSLTTQSPSRHYNNEKLPSQKVLDAIKYALTRAQITPELLPITTGPEKTRVRFTAALLPSCMCILEKPSLEATFPYPPMPCPPCLFFLRVSLCSTVGRGNNTSSP